MRFSLAFRRWRPTSAISSVWPPPGVAGRPPTAPRRMSGDGQARLWSGMRAHPMLPYLAQGAATALVDAVTLGSCTSAEPQISAAFRHYEALRKNHTARLQRLSRRQGEVYHLQGWRADLRNRALAILPEFAIFLANRLDLCLRSPRLFLRAKRKYLRGWRNLKVSVTVQPQQNRRQFLAHACPSAWVGNCCLEQDFFSNDFIVCRYRAIDAASCRTDELGRRDAPDR